MPTYNGSLLTTAEDLAIRLLPAFDTPTGIPLSWVNLRTGRILGDTTDTCTACATTLTLEWHLLSHFTGNGSYAAVASRAVRQVFSRRSAATGLVGNTLCTNTGRWTRNDASIGAGADSYYEYLLKMYLFSGEESYLHMFVEQYSAVQRGLQLPWEEHGAVPWLIAAHMHTGAAVSGSWLSSLSAFWPGLQVLSIGRLFLFRSSNGFAYGSWLLQISGARAGRWHVFVKCFFLTFDVALTSSRLC
jgi:hypothetical protein